MKLKHVVAAAAIAAAFSPAFADNQTIDMSSGQATFASTGTVLKSGDDVISFVNLAAGTYKFLLSLSAQNVSGLQGTVGQQPLSMISSGKFSFGSLESTASGNIALTLTGTAKSGAVYTGEMTVTAVPEPETYALLLAGLGAVGFVARRRKV
jgi:hypothetical protein